MSSLITLKMSSKISHIYVKTMSKKSNNQSKCIACGFNPLNFPNREPLYGEVADNHPVDSASVRL